jgi:hypothetical protein
MQSAKRALVPHPDDAVAAILSDSAEVPKALIEEAQRVVLRDGDLAPFTVTRAPAAVGCRFDATCGKLVFSKQKLTNGTTSVVAEPGRLASVTVGAMTSYRFWNVTDGQYGTTSTCDSYRPYAFWKER